MNRLSISLSNCHGCGLCAGVCPTDALSMKLEKGRYVPIFSAEKCISCKICENICEEEKIGKGIDKGNKFHPFIGYFYNCYIGYSKNLDIRKKSASGGLVTSLLIYLLNSGEVDGVIVTKLRYNGKNIETYPFIARTEQDIISASGSYYLPVDFSNVIKEIIKDKQKDEKFAIVALPCVISNLRNSKIPFLDKKIKYSFGLLCSNNFNYSMLEFIKHRMRISNGSNIQYLNFRSEWPEFVITIKTLEEEVDRLTEKEYKLNSKYWNFLFPLKMYIMSHRCKVCEDLFAEYSDISFGDAWLPSLKKNDKIGTNICISKTKKGEELLKFANFENIFISPIDSKKIIDSQKFTIYFKKMQNIMIKKNEDKFNKLDKNNINENRKIFMPQLLITIPITLLLDWFTYRYPNIMKKLPFFVYRVLYYTILINIVTGYKYMNYRR